MYTTADLYVNALCNDALAYLRIDTRQTLGVSYDLTRALSILNELLATLNSNNSKIPFFYSYDFQIVSGQTKYYIGTGPLADIVMPYIVYMPYITVDWGSGTYPIKIVTDSFVYDAFKPSITGNYPSVARVYKEQDTEGNTYTIIDLMYNPSVNYNAHFRGKPMLSQCELNDTLVALPMFFKRYLKLQLAKWLVPYYDKQGVLWSDMDEMELIKAEKVIKSSVELDMDVQTVRVFDYPVTGVTTGVLGVVT